MTMTYRRTSNYECEELEGELVIMERDSKAMVTLNPAGHLVWDAIETPVTPVEIEAVFREVFPNLGKETIRDDIQNVLDALITAGLAFGDDE